MADAEAETEGEVRIVAAWPVPRPLSQRAFARKLGELTACNRASQPVFTTCTDLVSPL